MAHRNRWFTYKKWGFSWIFHGKLSCFINIFPHLKRHRQAMSAKFGFDEKRNGQHDIFRDQQVVPQKDEITAFPRHDQLQRNIQ